MAAAQVGRYPARQRQADVHRQLGQICYAIRHFIFKALMIKTDTPSPSLRNHLIQGAFGSLGLKLSQTLLSLVWAVVLARLLGVDGFGIYVFCISIVNLLTIPAMLGGQQLLVREVAAYNARDELHFLFGLLQRMRRATTAASILLSLCAAGVGWWIYQESPLRWPFLIAMSLIPLITAMNLQGAVLWGLRHVLLGQANRVLLPALCLVLISCISWFKRPALTPTIALAAYTASAGLLVIAIHVVMRLVFPKSTTPIKPAYENSRWMHSMLPFMFSDAMQMLNNETSVVLLGAMQGTEAVGLFRVGQQGAGLVPFGLLAVNMAIAPIVAELFAKGEKQRLQHMISRSIIASNGLCDSRGIRPHTGWTMASSACLRQADTLRPISPWGDSLLGTTCQCLCGVSGAHLEHGRTGAPCGSRRRHRCTNQCGSQFSSDSFLGADRCGDCQQHKPCDLECVACPVALQTDRARKHLKIITILNLITQLKIYMQLKA